MDSLAHLDEEIRRTKPNAGAKRGLHHANLRIARSRLLWHDHGNVVDIGAQAAANAPRSSASCSEHNDLHKRGRGVGVRRCSWNSWHWRALTSPNSRYSASCDTGIVRRKRSGRRNTGVRVEMRMPGPAVGGGGGGGGWVTRAGSLTGALAASFRAKRGLWHTTGQTVAPAPLSAAGGCGRQLLDSSRRRCCCNRFTAGGSGAAEA